MAFDYFRSKGFTNFAFYGFRGPVRDSAAIRLSSIKTQLQKVGYEGAKTLE